MKPLRWSWRVRFGPFARATIASQPWLLAAVPLIVAGVTLLAPKTWMLSTRVLVGVAVALFATTYFLSAMARQLRRRQRTPRGQVQTYALGTDAFVLSVGKDSYSLPTAELVVATHGRDWLAVRRPATGRKPFLVFFDDPAVLPQAEAVLREHGASTRT